MENKSKAIATVVSVSATFIFVAAFTTSSAVFACPAIVVVAIAGIIGILKCK